MGAGDTVIGRAGGYYPPLQGAVQKSGGMRSSRPTTATWRLLRAHFGTRENRPVILSVA